MELRFLGAATTVTGSQFLLTTSRAKVLIDCGMFQGNPQEAIRNRVPLAYDPAEIDALLLTHAHLDHCGLIPHVVARGMRAPIFATAGTVELAGLVLLDSAKLQDEAARRDARWERKHPERAAKESTKDEANLRTATDEAAAADDEESAAETRDPEVTLRSQPPVIETSIDEPLYTMADTQATLRLFKAVGYDREIDVAPGVHATFLDAGHILGSAIIRVRVSDGDNAPEKIIVFSGDLGRHDTPIIRDPTTVSDADYLLVESTYGGREHEPQAEAVRILAETVQLVAQANGVLLVPSFAIGRTQEVVWQLDRLLDEKKIPRLPLYLDSPMASKATEIYRRHGEYYDERMRELLAKREDPLDYPGQRITNDIESSRAISKAPRPYMIVASNGMLTGGRVVNHLRELIDDPSATLLFVGYQGQGTLGAQLQAGVKTVRIDGEMRDVRCQIRSISGFSAHADESELLDWIGAFTKPRLKRVFIVHGDPDAQAAIEPKIRGLGFDTHIPKWHERVTLD
ncbi:MAG TPA: MBL fold metallo-hydrolase [Candidatus Limnocylindria bacterium]|nr:MBL fold metallo-hydrolase [Candidatus Limnocylindria bacterium]